MHFEIERSKENTGELDRNFKCPKCSFELLIESDTSCPFCGFYLAQEEDGPDTIEEYYS